MDPRELHRRVSEIVGHAAQLPPEAQETYVVAACGSDLALLEEVESLLAYRPPSGDLLDRPPGKWPGKGPADSRTTEVLAPGFGEVELEVGRRVGVYRLLEKLGQGGMGTVFLAAREDDFEKKVALKLINTLEWPHWYRRAPEGQDLVRRFHNERQILAQLEHPNIARILDGGATAEGMPYFAMEYVEGVPIDEYCDTEKLSVRLRLRLFLKVCVALQLAHQNLVVHRDLKPSNILVTAAGEPKLLDFGIAKQLFPPDQTAVSQTATGLRPMTLKYASPEQILERPITTASDTYALGVLLYQLLAGRFPYRLKNDEFLTWAKAICGQEPLSPSSAVMRAEEIHVAENSTWVTPELVSATREGTPRRLKDSLSGDLDSILLKALAKEPEGRYGSVEQLSEDIVRHLEGLPVFAREGKLSYRMGKFLWRHRVWIVMFTFFLLLAGAGLLSLARAMSAERKLKEYAELTEIFEALDEENEWEQEKAQALFERMMRLLEGDGGSLERAEFVDPAGKYRPETGKKFADFLMQRLLAYPKDQPELARGLHNLAALNQQAGDLKQAEKLYRASLAMKQRLGESGIDLVKSISNLAAIRMHDGDYEEAEELYLRCLRLRKEDSGITTPEYATSLRSLAVLYYNQGRFEHAEALLQEVLDIRIAVQGPASTSAASAWSSLGRVRQAQRRLDEAEGIFHHVLAIREDTLGKEHLHTALTRKDLGSVLLDQGDLDFAGMYLAEALGRLHSALPPDAWEIAEAESLWGGYLLARGRREEAGSCLLGSYQSLEAHRGLQATPTLEARRRLWNLLAPAEGAP